MNGTQNRLRPLALGEVLDRAVNLCVKYFVPLSLIFLVYAVPLAVVQYFATQDFAHILQTITGALTPVPGRPADPQALARALGSVRSNGWYAVLLALTFFVAPLPTAALISATSEAYLGRATSFARAYRHAAGRWLPLIGVNVLYGLALGAAYVALIIAFTLAILGIALVAAGARVAGIVLGAIVGVVGLGAMVAFFIVAALAFQVSYFTCVVERAGVRRSFGLGVSRVFGGLGLRRSLLVGIVFVALGLGIVVVSLAGEALLEGLLHSVPLGTAYATIVRVATAAFTTAFIAIFYFDLRVREEGLDLQLAAQDAQLAHAAPPSA
ncbi:MAG: hypothetical protein M3R53_01690 [Candidatus Eremiobacteraeota bacterium]|nr:hypothetical protein [Candidatus Eremiobacteraeota bacterium]